jgi:hypothetical protein
MKMKYVKIFTILSSIVLIVSYIVSFLITIFFGDNDFNILFNAVSDLGRNMFSPFPLLFDLGCIISGILMIPFIFYFFLSYLFKLDINFKKRGSKTLFETLAVLGFISLLNSDISLIGVGIFSLDRNPFYLHYIFTLFLFTGYLFFAFVIGLIYIIYKINLPKYLIISGFIYFGSFFIAFFLASIVFTSFAPFFEWILVFLMYSWFFLFSLRFVINHPPL